MIDLILSLALLLGATPAPAASPDDAATDAGYGSSSGAPVSSGSDAFSSPDAGVFQVSSAVSAQDGGTLGAGWWLSDQRLQKIGSHVVQLENERDQAKADLENATPATVGYARALLIGLGVGAVCGAATVFYLDRKVPSK